MDADGSPGSPRKKPKLEESLPIDSVIAMSDAVEENVAGAGGSSRIPPLLDDTSKPQTRDNTSEIPNITSIPVSEDVKGSPEALREATAPSDLTSDQLTKERACGITEFVSLKESGFNGVLKKRYTDFLVNEILPSGEVVHLTNLRFPKKEKHVEKPIETRIEHAAAEPNIENHSVNETHNPHTEGPQVPQETQSIEEPSTTNSIILTHTKVDRRADADQDEARQRAPEKTKHVENLLPHERTVLPHLTTGSNVNSSAKPSPSKETRTRQQIHLHHTDQGWTEFDKDTPGKDKEASSGPVPFADTTTGRAPFNNSEEKVELPSDQNPLDAARTEQSQKNDFTQTNTQAKWQAYADSNGGSPIAHKISDEDRAALTSYFPDPVVDAIRSLHNRILNSPSRATKEFGTVKSPVIDRQLRTRIHQDIRRIFQSRLETTTDNDGTMLISAMSSPANSYFSKATSSQNGHRQSSNRGGHQSSRGNFHGPRRPNWQELGGDFLHFTLYKENKDTMECISWLSKFLKLGPRSFEFAGTKDRRAVTVQRVSVYRQTVGHMIDAGKSLRQAYIGDYEYQPRALQLGELTGNEFTITLRDCKFDDSKSAMVNVEGAHSVVHSAMQDLVKRGFINYYGLQRFGTFSISTSEVGVKVLQGDFKGAVQAILHCPPDSLAALNDSSSKENRTSRDDKARSNAIHIFNTTGKAHQALVDLPKKFSAESAIIRHLGNRSEQNQDYNGALQSIQRNLRLMYVHAYQSLVWNKVASKRWSLYGASVIEGDLVLIDGSAHNAQTSVKAEEVDGDGEIIVKPAAEDRSTNVEDVFTRARTLSKEEAESGDYTVFDVVLPTPGFDILYPGNKMVKFYEDFMASPEGGGLDPHNMRRPQKDFSLSGSYRKLLAKPGQESVFEVKLYDDDDEQFVKTDLDRLNKARDVARTAQLETPKVNGVPEFAVADGDQVNKESNHDERHVENKQAGSDEDAESNGGVSLKKVAVILKLQLAASQYATMALRELMSVGGVKTYKPDFSGGR